MMLKDKRILLSLFLLLGILFLMGFSTESRMAEDLEIWADQMTIEQDKLIAEGNVIIHSVQGEMRGDYFEADNISESGVLSGNPSWKNKEGWLVTGTKFEIDFAREELFIPAEAHIESEEVVADSKQLHFFAARNEVLLTGEVEILNQGRRLAGQEVLIDLESEKMRASGSSRLLFPSSDLESGVDN